MELSEAKEILEDRDMLIDTLFETYNQSTVKPFDKAIDTVLKALDNSIGKEYHEMVMKEQNDIIDDLKSKLDNSINKDEIRKVRDNIEMKDYYLSQDGADDLTRLLGEEVEE